MSTGPLGVAQTSPQEKRGGRSRLASEGVGEPREDSLSSCDGFGSLLGTHPCNDTESDLVDHVSDVVEDSHDFCIDSVGQNVSGWVEQVAEGVDDPADADEPAQSVGAPHEFRSNLAVVDTFTGGPGGTGSHDDHGPADTTEDETSDAWDGTGLTEVAESNHDESTRETDAGEAEPEGLLVGDGVLANQRGELEGHQRDGDDPVHVSVLNGNGTEVGVDTAHVVVVEGGDTDDQGRDGHGRSVLWRHGVALCHEEDKGGTHGDVADEEEEECDETEGVISILRRRVDDVRSTDRSGHCEGKCGNQKQARCFREFFSFHGSQTADLMIEYLKRCIFAKFRAVFLTVLIHLRSELTTIGRTLHLSQPTHHACRLRPRLRFRAPKYGWRVERWRDDGRSR